MKVLTDNKYYGQIADVIREQNGTSNTYKPAQMVSALKDLFYEEVEGVPPITFQGIGENLLDYRIDGASGGVGERTSNLFDYKTWKNGITGISNSGNIIFNSDNSFTIISNDVNDVFTLGYSNYRVPVKAGTDYYFNFISNNTNAGLIYIFENGTNDNEHRHIAFNQTEKNVSFTTQPDTTYITIRFGVYVANTEITYKNISLVEGNSAPSNYEPYGYKVPVVVSGKNLLQNTATSQTKNGVTFTVNEDGSVTCNGTASDDAWFVVNSSFDLYAPEGRIASIGNNGSTSTFYMNISYIGNVTTSRNYSRTAHQNVYVQLVIAAGYTCDNLTFYPMIRKADIEDDTYEPYHEPTTTNIYLDEPIGENESISLSDTNVNIPTIRGTNVLSIDTTVQPSNVYIKSRHESSYETAMRERYEEAQAQLDALN